MHRDTVSVVADTQQGNAGSGGLPEQGNHCRGWGVPAVAEHVEAPGQSYETYIQQHIFDPL